MTRSGTRIRRTVNHIHRTWTELSYAQRRMFEIRTGLPPAGPRFSVSADELERHYRRDAA
jgi:hypothetical protein